MGKTQATGYRAGQITIAPRTPATQALTFRQIQIIELLIKGKRQKEIAALLGVTHSAIAMSMERACNKLNALTPLEAAIKFDRQKRQAIDKPLDRAG